MLPVTTLVSKQEEGAKRGKKMKRLRSTDCTEQEGEGCPETSGNTWREEDPQQEMADPLDFKDNVENEQEKLFSTSTAIFNTYAIIIQG